MHFSESHQEHGEISKENANKAVNYMTGMINRLTNGLGVTNPEGSGGKVLLSAVLTNSILWEAFYEDKNISFFGNNTDELENAPEAVKTLIHSTTSVPSEKMFKIMGIDPDTNNSLEIALARFTNTGITVTKGVAYSNKDIEYVKLAPFSAREDILKFIEYKGSHE